MIKTKTKYFNTNGDYFKFINKNKDNKDNKIKVFYVSFIGNKIKVVY